MLSTNSNKYSTGMWQDSEQDTHGFEPQWVRALSGHTNGEE